MKKTSFLASFLFTAVFVLSAALCSAQDSIAYQLVIRNSAGELVTNKQVNMRFALLKGDSVCYEETMPTKTDKYGNISVMVGTGKATKGAMKDVPWSTMDISMKVEADTDGGSSFKELGTVPMAAAPYAMYAATAGGNGSSGSSKDDEALFEVCDRDGQPVFAVYDNGIVVYVDETAKAPRSGFKVTGRNSKDGEPADYFSVDAEGTHVYVDDNADNTKTKRSGFVVTGRNSKGAAGSYTAERTADKSSGTDIFAVESGITHVYISEDESKAPRSGFVVTGRSTKGEGVVNISTARTDLLTSELNIAGKTNETMEPQPGEEPTQQQSLFTISSGQVGVNTGITMIGDVEKKVEAEIIDEFEINIDDAEIYTPVPCRDYLPNVSQYALMAIYSEDSYVAVTETDGQCIILFDEFGNITKQYSRAALLMVLTGDEIQIRTLKPMQKTVEFGLMDAAIAAAGEPYRFVMMKAQINAEQGYPFVAQTDGGVIRTLGEFSFGHDVNFVAVPDEGCAFVCWDDNNSQENRRSEYVGIDFETLSAKFVRTTYYVKRGGRESNNGLSEQKALPTIGDAFAHIMDTVDFYNIPNVDWTIKIVNVVRYPQTIADNDENKIIANSITITGSKSDCALDGSGDNGSALTIDTKSPIIISNLKITGGNAANGGGVYISNKATVTLADGAHITGNEVTNNGCGGGVYNAGTLFMYGSAVIGDKNKSQAANSSDYSNKAYCGGGLYNAAGASVYLGYRSVVDTAKLTGGIYHNYVNAYNEGNGGGGIYNNCGTIIMSSGNIAYNGTDSKYGHGAGVATYNSSNNDNSRFEFMGGAIQQNKCLNTGFSLYGGGVRVGGGAVFIMDGGEISDNTADYGGGVSVSDATFKMTGGVIKSNSGNGVLSQNSTFEMGNKAVVDANNYVNIEKGQQITIAQPFNNSIEQAANIIVVENVVTDYYENDLLVLSDYNDNAYVGEFRGLFKIKSQGFDENKKHYDTKWDIDETGKMQRTINVKAYTTGDNCVTTVLIGAKTIEETENIVYEGTSGCFDYSIDYWAAETTDGDFVKVEEFTHDTTVYAIWKAITNESLTTALSDIHDSRCNYIINVNGQISGQTEIPATLMGGSALSLTLNGTNTSASLNGNNSGTALTVSTAVPVIIKNLTITGGNASNGGGIYINNGANVTLSSGAKVSGNKATNNGGGIYTSGTLVLDGGVVGDETVTTHATYTTYSNCAIRGGGIYFDNTGKVLIKEGSVVAYNFGYQGGGIATANDSYSENAVLTIEGGDIQYNGCDPQTASREYGWSSYGGGLFLDGCKFVLAGGSIHHNFGCDGGGGLFLQHTTNATMSGGSIHNNTWHESGYKNGSEVLLFENCTLSMTSGSIYANNSVNNGVMLLQSSASLEMEGYATISSKTPVCLTAGTYIKVTGTLNTSNVATITPPSYSEEVQVLDGDFADSQSGKFKVTDEITSDGTKSWVVHGGHLCDKLVYYTNNYTSNITITDPSVPCIISGSEDSFNKEIYIKYEDANDVPNYNITLHNVNLVAASSKSALMLINNTSNTVTFNITLEGNNILYGSNHSGLKIWGSGISHVIFDTKQGEEATLEFKDQMSAYNNACLQVANNQSQFSLADGCIFVSGWISVNDIYDPEEIDHGDETNFNTYTTFDAFISAARATNGTQLCILKIRKE